MYFLFTIFLPILFLPQFNSFEFFIEPLTQPLNQCFPNGPRTCTGDITNPFDSLTLAIEAGLLSLSSNHDTSMVFNLIANSADGVFPLVPLVHSPFENYPGPITLQSVVTMNGVVVAYGASVARVMLTSEYFSFKILYSLTLYGVAIVGVDMHMDSVPCELRPNVILCSCYSESFLYDPDSVCSIIKPFVPNCNFIEPGFIQIIGPSAKLNITNSGFTNFNSFQRHVTLIYSASGAGAAIFISNMIVSQAYLADSFLRSDSQMLSLIVFNLQILRMNEFYIQDLRTTGFHVFSFKGSQGEVSIYNFDFETNFTASNSLIKFFTLEDTNFTIAVTAFRIINNNAFNDLPPYTVFSVTNSLSQFNTLILNQVLISNNNFLFLGQSPVVINVTMSNFSYSYSAFQGKGSQIYYSNVTIVSCCLVCDKWSQTVHMRSLVSNVSFSFTDCQGYYLGLGLAFADDDSTTINILRFFIYYMFGVASVMGKPGTLNPNFFNASQFIVLYVTSPVVTIFFGLSLSHIYVKDSIFLNLTSYQGEAGAFAVGGDGSSFSLRNVTVENGYSSGLGVLVCTFGRFIFSKIPIVISLLDSRFVNLASELIGNLMITYSELTIENCEFIQSIAKIGSLMYITNSIVRIRNITLSYSVTEIESLMDIMASEITIKDSIFDHLSGDSACFLNSVYSKVDIANISISDSTCSDSLVFFMGSQVTITEMAISGFSGGGILFFRNYNNALLRMLSVEECQLQKDSVINVGLENALSFQTVQVTKVQSLTSGAALYVNSNNMLVFDNICLNFVVSQDVGLFFILGNNSLSILHSVFNDSWTAVSAGVFYITQSVLRVKSSNFTNCHSEIDGFMSVNCSSVSIENSIIEQIYSIKETSAIFGMNSNLSMSFVSLANVYHKLDQFSFIDKSNVMISITNDINSNTGVIIDNCLFVSDGASSNALFSLNGVINVSLTQSSFIHNRFASIFSIIESNFFVIDLKFQENVAQTFVSFLNTKNFYSFIIQTQDVEVSNNTVDIMFHFMGNVTTISNKLLVFSNKKSGRSDFFSFITTNSIIFDNFICRNNEGFVDDYLFSFSLVSSISISDILFFSNDFQFLKCSNSSIKLSFLEIQSHLLKELMILSHSTVSIDHSLFTKDQELDLSPCLSLGFCYFQTLLVTNCSLEINNTQFKDREIHDDRLAQYEIYIVGSHFISISQTNFTNDYSQSIYAKDAQFFSLERCRFEILDYNSSLNGSILFENTRDEVYNISVRNSSFINLKTQSNASSFRYQNWFSEINVANIQLTDCTFSKNEASSGGAISLVGLTDLSIVKSLFIDNKANSLSHNALTGLGGSIFSGCNVPNKCYIKLSESVFTNNVADLGGGIFLINYEITEANQMTYEQNFAKILGENNNSNMSSPFFINLTYFYQVSEQALFFNATNQSNDNISVNNLKPIAMIFTIYNLNNLPCPYINSSVSASLSFVNSTIDYNSTGVEVINGTIEFPRVIFNGKLENSYTIIVRLEKSFKIQKNITLHVRRCTFGEYLDNNLTCEFCPYGSYSFNEPTLKQDRTICQPCPENSECSGRKIAPIYNFWINSSEFTTEILKCPIPGSCFYQEFEHFEKPMTCSEGYTGDLCVTCQNGFSKDGYQSKCLKCQWKAFEILIFIFKVLFMLLFVSVQINSVLFSKFKKDAQFSGTSVKIIRDHFNQIFLIYSFCSIFQIDDNYFTIYQNVNNVVTGTTLNFECFYQEHYSFDIFYFKMIMFMISPFVLHFVISLLFLAFFFLKKFVLRKNVMLKCYFKTILIAFIVICDSQYTQILISFLKLFECTRLDSNNPNTYLVYAPHIRCYSDDHYEKILFIGLPCLVIWIIGLPGVSFTLLYLMKARNRHKGSLLNLVRDSRKSWVEKSKKLIVLKAKDEDSPSKTEEVILGTFELDLDAALMLSFLFAEYSENRYYWSSIIMIWKAVISIFVTFITDESIYFALFGFYLCLNWVYTKSVPYQNNSIMHLVKASLICNGISIVLGQYIDSEKTYKDEVVLINLLMHISFFVFAVFLNLKEFDYSEILKKAIEALEKKKDSKISNKVLKTLKKITMYSSVDLKLTTQMNFHESEPPPMSLFSSARKLHDRAEQTEDNVLSKENNESPQKSRESIMEIPEEVEHNVPIERTS